MLLLEPLPIAIVLPLDGSELMVIVPRVAVPFVIKLTPSIMTPCPVARQYRLATAIVPVAAVGGLASKVTLSMANVEEPEMLEEVRPVDTMDAVKGVPAAPLPRGML